jgi:prepilin-type N-terminal cleavage/methylation domain-containing protein
MQARAKFKGHEDVGAANSGFSLVELLIVVAIILIIAAIAIPNFIRSKQRANESAAAQDIRSITTAEVIYSTTYGIGFSDNLVKLAGTAVIADSNSAGLIDDALASGLRTGYTFSYTAVTTDPQGHVTSYSINADPQSAGATGQRHFYTDQTGVIRWNNSAAAGPSDPAIQ